MDTVNKQKKECRKIVKMVPTVRLGRCEGEKVEWKSVNSLPAVTRVTFFKWTGRL